jgi:hypothetical protein
VVIVLAKFAKEKHLENLEEGDQMRNGNGRVTQMDIAKACNLDVSSANKILNRVSGAVFRDKTVQMVFKTAKEMGYDFGRSSKGSFRMILEQLFPKTQGVRILSALRGVTQAEARRIMKLLYGSRFEPFPKEERPL